LFIVTGTKPISASVPNAPCGVESLPFNTKQVIGVSFLMHRVELKGGLCGLRSSSL